jgi:hypothetical protein
VIKITREGDNAIIQYADDAVATTYYRLGRDRLATMTDEEILADWNEHIEARDELMRSYKHVAVEAPPGRPQVDHFARGDQWVPRGHVLRCIVQGSTGEPDEPFITIDDREFTPVEFAKMVSTFGGCSCRQRGDVSVVAQRGRAGASTGSARRSCAPAGAPGSGAGASTTCGTSS